MNVYQFVFLSPLVLGWDVGFDCIVPDHCLSFYFLSVYDFNGFFVHH